VIQREGYERTQKQVIEQEVTFHAILFVVTLDHYIYYLAWIMAASFQAFSHHLSWQQ
jgi:hypothetical protein